MAKRSMEMDTSNDFGFFMLNYAKLHMLRFIVTSPPRRPEAETPEERRRRYFASLGDDELPSLDPSLYRDMFPSQQQQQQQQQQQLASSSPSPPGNNNNNNNTDCRRSPATVSDCILWRNNLR